jgi:hypothetical protein
VRDVEKLDQFIKASNVSFDVETAIKVRQAHVRADKSSCWYRLLIALGIATGIAIVVAIGISIIACYCYHCRCRRLSLSLAGVPVGAVRGPRAVARRAAQRARLVRALS